MLKNKTIGFYIAFFSGAAAVVASVAYLAIYMATAAETVDRVFSWFTFGFMLAGGLIATAILLSLAIMGVMARFISLYLGW